MSLLQDDNDTIQFFNELETSLEKTIEPHYFDIPRRFRYLIEVIEVMGKKIEQKSCGGEDPLLSLHSQNPAYNELLQKRTFINEVIEEIVTFQHGSLNNSVETMGDVISAYCKSKDEVSTMRESIREIKSVLTSKKTGQTDIKKLWLAKTELEESIRMLNKIEVLKDAPSRVQLLTNQNRYLAAVTTLNTSVDNMFDADFMDIDALAPVREQLLELKGRLLERMADELKDAIVGVNAKHMAGFSSRKPSTASRSGIDDDATESILESEAGISDHRSEAGRSLYNGSQPDISEQRPPRGSSRAPMTALRSNVHFTKAPITSSNVWSTDLSEATEAAEASLLDPKAAGSLYIRLLVKGIGSLHCEDDAERMLFEGAAEQFRVTIRRIKVMRKKAAEVVDTTSPPISGESAAKYDDEALTYRKNIAEFTAFVKDMLDAAFTMLKMALYIIRLLNQSKKSTRGISIIEDKKGLKDNIKKSVLNLWSDAQDTIVGELSRHFVEQAVKDMCDDDQSGSDSNHDREDLDNRMLTASPLPINADDDGARTMDDMMTVCPSSARLAAPVYKAISSFSERAHNVLKDEVDSNISTSYSSRVHVAVQRTLEDELMPLVQSEVNAEMRDLQMDSQLFVAPTESSRNNTVDAETGEVRLSYTYSRVVSKSMNLYRVFGKLYCFCIVICALLLFLP